MIHQFDRAVKNLSMLDSKYCYKFVCVSKHFHKVQKKKGVSKCIIVILEGRKWYEQVSASVLPSNCIL